MPEAATVTVRVPASTSNLGPGFDVVGMALQLYNTITVERVPDGVHITAAGEAAEDLAQPADSLVVRAIQTACAAWGKPVPGLRIHLDNRVPLARGLGGSSTAVVGGIVAAAALCGQTATTDDILALALALEGHPDNVTPALVGGLVICTAEDGRVRYQRLPLAVPNLKAVACVPDQRLATKAARAVLPQQISLKDAIFNLQSLAFLLTGLTLNHPAAIAKGMRDKLHQPYRAPLMPALEPAIAAALAAGALGSALSGAGSTIFAFAQAHTADRVAAAMQKALDGVGMTGRTLILDVDTGGAQILRRA